MRTSQCSAVCRSPLGNLKIVATEKGLSHVQFSSEEATAPSLVQSLQPHIHACLIQLDEYFFGGRRMFESLHLHFAATEFQEEVWGALRKVPFGETVSYGELARRAGHPEAARAVGTAMSQNPLPIIIPCHRVLPVDGSLGNYIGGTHRKDWLLRHELRAAARRAPLPA